jgi:RNA polymerase sigma factor (sigma-70 family)
VSFRQELDDFGAFYERTYETAYRTAYGIVGDSSAAADVTQEAFYKAYKTRASFRGESPARSWLLRIVVNAAISSRRRPRIEVLDVSQEPIASELGHAERLELSDDGRLRERRRLPGHDERRDEARHTEGGAAPMSRTAPLECRMRRA